MGVFILQYGSCQIEKPQSEFLLSSFFVSMKRFILRCLVLRPLGFTIAAAVAIQRTHH